MINSLLCCFISVFLQRKDLVRVIKSVQPKQEQKEESKKGEEEEGEGSEDDYIQLLKLLNNTVQELLGKHPEITRRTESLLFDLDTLSSEKMV